MCEILHRVDLIREAITPLEIMLNVDFLTDEFEKIDVRKEVLKTYRSKVIIDKSLCKKEPDFNNKLLQMYKLYKIFRG